MLKVEVPSSEIIERRSKAGNLYYQQPVYVHTKDRNGNSKPYPEEVLIFCRRDGDRPVAYEPGFYTFSPDMLRVNSKRLEVGFIELRPLKDK